jgi:hypothetical protein
MFCVNCAKLALLATKKICINCGSAVLNNLSVLCDFCSEKDKACSICLKKILNKADINKSRYRGCGRCGK